MRAGAHSAYYLSEKCTNEDTLEFNDFVSILNCRTEVIMIVEEKCSFLQTVNVIPNGKLKLKIEIHYSSDNPKCLSNDVFLKR